MRRVSLLLLVLLCACKKEEVVTDTAAIDTAATDTSIAALTPHEHRPYRFPKPRRHGAAESSTDQFPESLPTVEEMLRDGSLPVFTTDADGGFFQRSAWRGTSVTVLRDDGSSASVTPSSSVIVAQIATWCPYSRQYVAFLQDPATTPFLAGKKLVFLLDQDEWPSIRRQFDEAIKNGEMTKEEVDERIAALKDDAGNGAVYDPDMLQDLPGEYYFLPAKSAVAGDGVPGVYSPTTKKCSEHPVEAFQRIMPITTLVETWRRHAPEKS